MYKKTFYVLALILILLSAACAPQATPAPTAVPEQPAAVEATQVPPTEAPAAAPTEVPTESAAPASTESSSLTVLAAASLSDAFKDIAAQFEAANPNVKVELSFAGSQQCAQQLSQGAPADVFASASKKYMDAVVESDRVEKDTAKTFAKNRLVVVFPKANPAGITGLKDLNKAGLKVVLAAKEVPAGNYALQILDNTSKDASFGATFKDDVLKNVVSYEDNVRAVLTKVSLGEADAGIVYVSDVTSDVMDKVEKADIPDELNVIATYPIAVIKDSKNMQVAQTFMDFVLSEAGQNIMSKWFFLPAK